MSADQDRFLRNKISDDSSHLVKENSLLQQQVMELQKQIDRVLDNPTLSTLFYARFEIYDGIVALGTKCS